MAFYVLSLTVIALLLSPLGVPSARAEVVTVKKSYSYDAGPLDDEYSSRAVALTKVKLMLFNAVAGYLGDVEGAAVLSPGVVAVQEIDRSWDGKVYYIEAAVAIEPEALARDIRALSSEREKKNELMGLRRRAVDSLIKMENLNEQGDLRQYLRYDELLNELVAVEALEKGYAAITRGDYPMAVKSFTAAIEVRPKSAPAYYNRGAAQWMLENYGPAMDDFKKALAIDPRYNRAKASIQQAEAFFRNIEDTVRYYDNAIAVNPADVSLYYERGLAHWELGNMDEALRDFTMVTKLMPEVEDGFINRGGVYLAMEEYEAAYQDFKTAVEVNPRSTMAHFNLGLLNLRLQRYEDALKSFTRVIELEPSDGEALYNRGLVYDEMGRSKQAISDMQRAAKFGHGGASEFLATKGLVSHKGAQKAAKRIPPAKIKPPPKEKARAEKKVKAEDAIAEKKEPSASEAKEDVSQASPKRRTKTYAVQAGAFSNIENAEELAGRIKKRGYDAYVHISTFKNKGSMYLVLIGRYSDKRMAEDTMQRLKADKINSFVKVLND